MQDRESFKRPPARPPDNSSALPVLLALMLMPFVIGLLVFLTMGLFGIVILVGGGLLLIILLQYLTWGWLLEKYLREDVAEDKEDHNESEE